MTAINSLYERKKERWEDDRPSAKHMTIKIKQPKQAMNWNGLKPMGERKEQTAQ